ncbi:MAG: S-layer homology domain-containing protein [Thermoanaerobacteraceae bacterium]|nr:S-layer homology domain-containing protein [Thermoanaerobacteraceae bacterium]
MRQSIKRFFVFLTVFLMTFSTAYAGPVQVANSNPFSDVPDNHWAIQYILDMYNKGIILGSVQGTSRLFKPEEGISKIEVVSLLARVMGSNGNETAVNAAYEKYKSVLDQAKIPSWAAKEVAYAMDRGVVTEDDIKTFIDSKGSQVKLLRHEAAIYIVRAMGLESTAKSLKYPTLSFTDYFSIPDASVPYIKVAVDEGVFNKNGDSRGRFNPLDQIKRAEIAKILSVSYDKINKTSETSPNTTSKDVTIDSVIQSSNVNYLSYKTSDDKTEILNIDSKVTITLDGRTAILSDLKNGMPAKIEVKNNVVTRIEASSPEKKISGTVFSIFYGSDPILTIEDEDGNRVSYHLTGASIKKDGKTATVNDVEPKDTIEAVATGDKILSLEVTSGVRQYEGTMKEVKMVGAKLMLTMDTDDGIKSFEISDDVSIKRNKRSAEWTDLKKGDDLEVTVESELVTVITATSTDRDISGSITEIRISSNPEITITTEDGDMTYALSKGAEIKVDGRTAVDGIYNLRLGYQADASVESDEIVKLIVSSVKEKSLIFGTIKRIDKSSNLISLSVYDETTKKTSDMVILVTVDTKIYDRDGDIVRLRDLDEGDSVTVRVQDEGGILNAIFISVE